MKKLFGILMILVALSATASAQEPAEMVQTNGTGEIRRASEVMVAPGGSNPTSRIPGTVRKGDVIAIQFQSAGSSISDSFEVTGITISGDRCAIESKHHNADGIELIDVIFARPCSRLK